MSRNRAGPIPSKPRPGSAEAAAGRTSWRRARPREINPSPASGRFRRLCAARAQGHRTVDRGRLRAERRRNAARPAGPRPTPVVRWTARPRHDRRRTCGRRRRRATTGAGIAASDAASDNPARTGSTPHRMPMPLTAADRASREPVFARRTGADQFDPARRRAVRAEQGGRKDSARPRPTASVDTEKAVLERLSDRRAELDAFENQLKQREAADRGGRKAARRTRRRTQGTGSADQCSGRAEEGGRRRAVQGARHPCTRT